MKAIITALAALLLTAGNAWSCSSLIASGKATLSGRPILWKHRDTSASNNFLYRVEARPDLDRPYGYVALFNGADSLCLDEAWMGMNDAGFAVMNTVAYNLPENDPEWADREGYVMALALARCATVDDFAALLDSLPKPTGVRTDFGVIDAAGNGAYFETDDNSYTRFDLADSPTGVLIRTNYAVSGTPDKGMGYVRYANVEKLLAAEIESGTLTPMSLTDGVSISFYNDILGYDAMEIGDAQAVDQDFVPRRSSTASVVVEGILPGETPDRTMMWAKVGYPPCTHTVPVTLTYIPDEAGPTSGKGAFSPAGLKASEMMKKVFPVERGNGPKYIDLNALRPILAEEYAISLANYIKACENRK